MKHRVDSMLSCGRRDVEYVSTSDSDH